MKLRPKRPINPNEIVIHYQNSTVRASWWEDSNIHPAIINNLFAYLESYAFMNDYVILSPVNLIAEELTHFSSYQVELSAPMMRAEDWEQGIVRCDGIINCAGLMCPYAHVTQVTLDDK